MSRPVLALTVGDVAGIGGEIVLRLLAEGGPPAGARLLVVGDEGALARDRERVPGAPSLPRVDRPEDLAGQDLDAGLLAPLPRLDPLPAYGVLDAASGRASHAWVAHAASLAMRGAVDGVVTGPIHKEAWRLAGVARAGHTEVLRDLAGVERVLMLLVGGRLRCALATIHVALRDVPALLASRELTDDLVLLSREIALKFGGERPRIAVCGLNPHAGEGGLFGREENDVIEPAIEAARGRGVDAVGPLPADACIPAAAAGAYDAVFAMFHDQALPAVKTLAPRRAVNVTLGLPFVRTSVDHGTAFDIAGRGVATASSLAAAVALAVEMAPTRAN